MNRQTIDTIEKVKRVVGEYQDVFNAIISWYKDAKLTVRVARWLLKKNRACREAAVTINGLAAQRECDQNNPWPTVASWCVPSHALKHGENEIMVRPDGKGALHLVEAGIFQENDAVGRRTVVLAGREPASDPRFRVLRTENTSRDRDSWVVKKNGLLGFRLHIDALAPVVFSLEFLSDEALAVEVDELLRDLLERVREKQREFEELLSQQGLKSELQRQTEESLRDLDDYVNLHKTQIEPAFAATGDAPWSDPAEPADIIEPLAHAPQISPAAAVDGGIALPEAVVAATKSAAAGFSLVKAVVCLTLLAAAAVPITVAAGHEDKLPRSIRNLFAKRSDAGRPSEPAKAEPVRTQVGSYWRGNALTGPISLPATRREPTATGLVLTAGQPYIVVAEGVCSLWGEQVDGCDSVYRYRAPERFGGKQQVIWGQLKLVNPTVHLSELIERQSGSRAEYQADHVYAAVVLGEGKELQALVYDGGGYSDNAGALKITVYEAIPAGGSGRK